MANYLITGYHGEPHVTAENDRGLNAATYGKGKFVLPVGEQFRAEYIGHNTIRMYDGKLMNNGAAAGIPVNEYEDFEIANATQGMKRNDLIVFQYEKDLSTLRESGSFVLVQGVEGETAIDPELTDGDLLTGNISFDQMALWRVTVEGTTINAPVRVTPVRWQNPPMDVGVEYQTAEKWGGKPVYVVRKAASVTASSTKTTEHGIANIEEVIDVFGSTSYGSSLHYNGITNVFVSKTVISITTNANTGISSAYVAFKYTKTTD